MPDYSKCVIYTIRTPNGLYVGSTCNFINRKHQHKSAIHNENGEKYNRNLYKNIRENNDEWEMKPHSEFPCKNKMEMTIEEERVRRELNADLNMRFCYGFDKEKAKQYIEVNKEKFAEQQKQYRENNKEKLAEKNRQYRENNKEKAAEYQKGYYQKNKEKLAEKQRQYREKKKAEKLALTT